uniref:Phosphodiesterase I n=2 Tax=Schistosoma mansoni TaxID=6183 RepID=A0A5K4F3H5_SCHMA
MDEEVIKEQEDGLRCDILDLKAQIEENELIHGIPSKGMGSVYVPKDPEHFSRERKCALHKSMQVLQPQSSFLQADLMVRELDASSRREYTEKSIPILLHQFFIDRMHQMVILKHSHLLRWKRYCFSTSATESICSEYLNKLQQLTNEYLDASSRARRLASTTEGLLAGSDCDVEDVTVDDYQVYLRHMIYHLRSLSYVNQISNMVKWFPYHYRDKLKESLNKENTDAAKKDHLFDKQVSQEHKMLTRFTPINKTEILYENFSDDRSKRNDLRTMSNDEDDIMSLTVPKDKDEVNINRTSGLPGKSSAYNKKQEIIGKVNTNTSKENGNENIRGKSVSFRPNEEKVCIAQNEGVSERSPRHLRFSDQARQPSRMEHSISMSPNDRLLTKSNSLLLAVTSDVANEKVSVLPLYTNDLETLRPHLILLCQTYNIQMDIDSIRSIADEMELFAVINRKFQYIFNRQEEMYDFRTYDHTKAISERWGLDMWLHAMKKPGNWLEFIKLKPKRDECVVKTMMELRCNTRIDELLLAASKLLHFRSSERVQDALRHHVMVIQHPPKIQTASVVSHKDGQNTVEIFKKIYTNPELYSNSIGSVESGKSKSDDYDFAQTMRLLGLDDDMSGSNDSISGQGAFLSFLHLRHLKLRDLMRTCISVLNYFRSIERTLTINDQGLSMNSKGGVERTSPQNHRVGVDGQDNQRCGNSLNVHGYLFNTPQEFKVKELEFMQFAEVENHDDFYYHEEGRIHVKDQVGYWIVYDCALNDFKELEHDLLLIATKFLQNNKPTLISVNDKQKSTITDTHREDLDIASYAHREVDRFGILYDIWSNETAFQETKKNLMDIYVEAYNHIISRDSRRKLAQMMTDLMYKRPRLDLNENYFVTAYKYECAILRQRKEIMKSILNNQVSNEREYLKKLHADKVEYGLPPPLIEKCLIAPNTDEPVLCPVYLLEFHPSLACTPSLIESMDESVRTTITMLTPKRQIQRIILEKLFFDYLKNEIDTWRPLGTSYTAQIQKDLFSPYFIEDVVQMSELCNQYILSVQQRNSRGDKKTRQNYLLNELGRLLDLVTLRHRLLDCMWECEILSKLYLSISNQMGFNDFHLFIRPSQFESAKYKEGVEELKPPIYITSIHDDDSSLDKYLPSTLPLAIHELDETQVGKFSFRGKATVMEMLEPRGIENLLTILQVQTVHKNGLIAAILLAFNGCPAFYTSHAPKVKNGLIRTVDTGNNSINNNEVSDARIVPNPLTVERSTHQLNAQYYPEAFFSIQLEKGPSRDRVCNAFIKKTQGGGVTASKSTAESEKMKREFITQFCHDYCERVQHASLRAQIIETYSSILITLENVPVVREEFFIIGYAFEKKSPEEDLDKQETDFKSLRNRPRRVLSSVGTEFYNLWFIPHFIEVLFVFRHLNDEACTQALRLMARIARALHDILHYLVAYARLGISSSRITAEQKHQISSTFDKNQIKSTIGKTVNSSKQTTTNVTSAGSNRSRSSISSTLADPTTPLDSNIQEHSLVVDQLIATELREIQYQINHLPNSTDPEQIIQLLTLRREIMFLKFDLCIRNTLGETFLAAGNEDAYNELTENSRFPLFELSNSPRPCVNSIELSIPEPLEPQDDKAQEILPWRTMINYYGPYLQLNSSWKQIEHNIRLCLAGLKPVDRPTVHGELLAMNLTLDDIVETGDLVEACAGDRLAIQEADNMHLTLGKRTKDKKREGTPKAEETIVRQTTNTQTQDLDRNTVKDSEMIKLSILNTPIAAYELIKKYLILRKRIESLKYAWGTRRLGIERINTSKTFKMFCSLYKNEQLYSLIRNLSLQFNQPDIYTLASLGDTDIFVIPKNIPEIIVRQRQLLKLIEAFELFMISDLRKLIVRQTDLVIKERNREEGNLPLDLWKRPAMKETLSVKRPALAEEFLNQLISHSIHNEESDIYTITKENFNLIVQNVAISVMYNEKETFEHYSMYYENLLKNQHHLMYANEREIQDLRDKLHQKDLETGTTVQFQMSEQVHDLLLEVTALRARILELEAKHKETEAQVQKRVRKELDDSIRKLFGISFEQKSCIDEYRNQLKAITLQRIAEIKEEASTEMLRIKERTAVGTSADELAKRNYHLSKEITTLHQYNISLQQMMNRLKVMSQWQQTTLKCTFEKQLGIVENQRNQNKTNTTRMNMLSEQHIRLLNEEITNMREHLANTQKHLNDLRIALDKEMKDKIDRKHAAERKAATDKQMAIVKQMHIDQLITEITEKDNELNEMNTILSVSAKSRKQEADKSIRQVDLLRKQLKEEKRLKQSALQKIDDIMSQLYQFESVQTASSEIKQKHASANLLDRTDKRQSTGIQTKVQGDQVQKTRPVTVSIPSLRERLAEKLLKSIPPDAHIQLVQFQKEEKAFNN